MIMCIFLSFQTDYFWLNALMDKYAYFWFAIPRVDIALFDVPVFTICGDKKNVVFTVLFGIHQDILIETVICS